MLELTSTLKAINLSYQDLLKFVVDYIQKNNGQISQSTAELIISYLSNNLCLRENN
jgi:DNA polymerase-3 subunit delta